jgi:hypothetical protein
MELLLQRPEFLRFIFELIQISGVLSATTDGSVGRDLAYFEGRRNLGLEILDLVEAGQPVERHPLGPILTLMQVFREETLKPTETQNAQAKSSRFNRNDELADAIDDDAS